MSTHYPSSLSEILDLAAHDPSKRPAFVEELMNADIYLLQSSETNQKNGSRVLKTGEMIEIHELENNGIMYIPFFSSTDHLLHFYQAESRFLCISARALFEITRGKHLVLNPGSDTGKFFTPDEVDSLLAGKYGNALERRELSQDTPIRIGMPEHYPHELAASLAKYFHSNGGVSSAHIGLYQESGSSNPPHTIIAVDTKGDFDKLMEPVNAVIAGIQMPNPPVDFLLIDRVGAQSNREMTKSMFKFFDRNISGGLVLPSTTADTSKRPWWKFW